MVTFNEPLLASTVNVDTVQFMLGDDELSYTVALSADGHTITVEFDPRGTSLPFDATLSFDGVTDRAGNGVDEVLNWCVPAWLEESIDGENLRTFRLVEIDDQEYLVAIHEAEKPDEEVTIRIFQVREGTWEHLIPSDSFTAIYALDAVVRGGVIYVAYLTAQAPNRRVRLLASESVITFPAHPAFAPSSSAPKN